ncbi:MAG TPA: response regulator [Nitrososphaeraceae archaeon]|nr:response regulator [Nitrososphaeraceae archaeon]
MTEVLHRSEDDVAQKRLRTNRQTQEQVHVEKQKNKSNLTKILSSHTTIDKRSPSQYAILVVDDEPDITLALKKGLENNGFKIVDTFNDPVLALSSFKTDFYDLILLDVKMPKMNGFELYRQMEKKERKKGKAIKACFITAYEIYYESLKEQFPTLNVGCFITKPIEIDALIKRIYAEIQSQ